jgi:hypothetical protein
MLTGAQRTKHIPAHDEQEQLVVNYLAAVTI